MNNTTTITPYLTLYGKCDDALKFYEKWLGAEIGMAMRFSDAPDMPEGAIDPDFKDKVMHCQFSVRGTTIFASDGGFAGKQAEGISFAIEVQTKEEADEIFNSLVQGGSEVIMPMAETFWSPYYGMINDPFNVGWMIMIPGEPA
jgi:PhnB protein